MVRSPRAATLVGVGVLVVLAAVLHLWAGYTSPRPWPDESHFIAPALSLLDGKGFDAAALNAPGGIFWMPNGHYVALAPLLLAGVDPLVAGRLLSLLGVLLFAVTVAVAAVRAGVPRVVAFGAAAVWLCLPRVVTIANIGRMEGLVLGLAGLAVWLTSRDRWPLALAAAWLTPLLHPIGLVVAVAVTGAVLVRTRGRRWRTGDWIVLGVVVLLWVVQLTYFFVNGDAAAAHLGFQIDRKAGRAITLRWFHWVLLGTAAVAGAVATVRWHRTSAPLRATWILLALVGGFVLVDVVGREMWYEFIGRETALLLATLAGAVVAFRWARRREPTTTDDRPPALRVATVVLAGVLVLATGVAVRQTLTGTWYGMHGSWSSRTEWHTFTDQAVARLQELDRDGGPPATVVIDPLSGFGQEVFARPWQRLVFVQPTPATPMSLTAGEYVLATPGAPFVSSDLVAEWGSPPPAVEVRSPRGTYSMQLFARP